MGLVSNVQQSESAASRYLLDHGCLRWIKFGSLGIRSIFYSLTDFGNFGFLPRGWQAEGIEFYSVNYTMRTKRASPAHCMEWMVVKSNISHWSGLRSQPGTTLPDVAFTHYVGIVTPAGLLREIINCLAECQAHSMFSIDVNIPWIQSLPSTMGSSPSNNLAFFSLQWLLYPFRTCPKTRFS